MKTIAVLCAILLGGCQLPTAAERRQLAEDALAVGIRRASAAYVRPSMELDGFTAEEVDRFAGWLEKRADKFADAMLDKVRED
jgi:hypothetical protein